MGFLCKIYQKLYNYYVNNNKLPTISIEDRSRTSKILFAIIVFVEKLLLILLSIFFVVVLMCCIYALSKGFFIKFINTMLKDFSMFNFIYKIFLGCTYIFFYYINRCNCKYLNVTSGGLFKGLVIGTVYQVCLRIIFKVILSNVTNVYSALILIYILYFIGYILMFIYSLFYFPLYNMQLYSNLKYEYEK